MPYKANEPRRHKIPRARYRVENWAAYDAALRRRGDLTIWVSPEAIAAWTPPATGRRGRPSRCSDIAIETGLMMRLAFGRPWRQTEGLLGSLGRIVSGGNGRCGHRGHRLHRAEGVWQRRVAPREARRSNAPELEKSSSGG
ncbi:hypothetical protein [Azospirillum palustre]